MAGANLVGPVAVEENNVVFRVRITDPNSVDYVLEQLLDGDNVAQGPLQNRDNTVSRHNVSVRS